MTMNMKKKQQQYVHIPAELIEQILLKLPIKSLFRFSTVSKSWNSMILGREFTRKYRGPEMMVMGRLIYPLRSPETTPFLLYLPPFNCDASCGELWCVEYENSLILHNPAGTEKYRKLPIPSARVPIGSKVEVDGYSTSVFVYGLGYDSAGDDYKILKIHRYLEVETELYSLKTDSWTKVESPPSKLIYESEKKCVCAGGALHWSIRFKGKRNYCHGVLSFDLNTHTYSQRKVFRSIFTLDDDLGIRNRNRNRQGSGSGYTVSIYTVDNDLGLGILEDGYGCWFWETRDCF